MITTSKYLINKLSDEYIFNTITKNDFKDYYIYNSTDIIDDLKYVIANKLTLVERGVLLLYISIGSYNKLGKELGVSTGTAYSKVAEIKQKILKYIKK